MRIINIILVSLIILINPLMSKVTHTGADDEAIRSEAVRFQGSLIFDKNGVPYYNYSFTGHYSIGLQGSPLAVSSHALDLYREYLNNSNQSAKTYFINKANWLAGTHMLKNNGSIASYEFSFPWQIGNNTVEPPCRSAMANAEALSPLVKAFHGTGNNSYLDTAKRLLWYEQYASTNSTQEPRALSGMMNAILAINEYYNDTKDPSAKFLLDQGILALKNDVPKYDNNGILYYDIMGLPANPFYKRSYVVQLEKLYKLTNEPIFKIYHDKWDNYNIINKS
jgi:heparosan-N-sulfate-glucuronate 5-epimerase